MNTNNRFFLVAGKCTNAAFIPDIYSYISLFECCNINFGTDSLKGGKCNYTDECNKSIVPSTPKSSNKPTLFAAPPTSKPIDSPSKLPSSIPSISLGPTHSPTSSLTIEPSVSPTYYPSYSPTMWLPDVYSDPISAKCSKSEARIRIEVLTDSFPRDTSWVFKRKREKNGRDGALLMRSHEYKKVLQRDIREMCLDEGTYEFIIRDMFQDGLCCDHGSGHYKIFAKSNIGDWQLIVAGAEFVTKEVRHMLQVQKNEQLELICNHPQRKIRIEIKTDNFGEDTSWQVKLYGGVIIAKNERVYGKRELDSRDLCLEDKSLYEFIVFDTYGDGICCQFGKGHYKIITYTDDLFHENITSPDGVTVLHGGMFFEQNITHTFNTTMPLLPERDLKWLEAHNLRRKKYHAEYEADYVPLQWSDGLKAEGIDTDV